MLDTKLSRSEVIQFALRKLGLGMVSVRITDDQANDAVDHVLRVFNRMRPRKYLRTIPLTTGVQKYELPVVGGGVVDVRVRPLDPLRGSYYDMDPLTMRVSNTSMLPTADGPLTALEAARQNYNMAVKMLGNEFDWEVLKADQSGTGKPVLIITPPPSQEYELTYTYLEPHLDVDTIEFSDHAWIQNAVSAEIKGRIGRMRSKYPNGIPGVDGGVSTDGSELVQEAAQEWEALTAELERRRAPMSPSLW